MGWRGAEDPEAAVFSSQSGQHGRVWVHSHSQRLGANTHLHTGHPCKCLSVCPPCLRSFCPSIHSQASSPLGSRDWSWGREPDPAGTEAGVRAGSRACEEAQRSHPTVAGLTVWSPEARALAPHPSVTPGCPPGLSAPSAKVASRRPGGGCQCSPAFLPLASLPVSSDQA